VKTQVYRTVSSCFDATTTLVYAVVDSRIDYYNTVLAGAPRTVTDKLQRALNAAARVVTETWKFDRGLGQILHDELHCIYVHECFFFKLAVTVHRCLNGCATPYLSDYCVPAAGVDTRQHLHSTNRQLLAVPRYWLNTYGRRAFSVAGLTVWNSLPDFIRDPTISADCFRRLLKTYLLLPITALYKFTYLLTYDRSAAYTLVSLPVCSTTTCCILGSYIDALIRLRQCDVGRRAVVELSESFQGALWRARSASL